LSAHQERARGRRRRRRGLLVTLLLVLVAFAIGVALGEALHDNPRPGGTQTTILTLKP
jgi:hypothetical protein